MGQSANFEECFEKVHSQKIADANPTIENFLETTRLKAYVNGEI